MTTATLIRPAGAARRRNPPPAAVRLIAGAQRALAEAAAAGDPLERYACAHLAALRAAAAVLADLAEPGSGKPRRPTSAWALLAASAPDLTPWATFFATGAAKRVAAEAGLPNAVTTTEADDLLHDATAFVAVVETRLGMLALGGAPVATRRTRQ